MNEPPITEAPKPVEIEVPEGIRRARAAFLRDFDALFADRKIRDKYVCYHKEERILVGKDYLSMIRELNARKIPENESLIFKVTLGNKEFEQAVAEEAELP